MRKKLALAFAGLMVIIMTASFAPTTNAPWPPIPTHQEVKYVVLGGEVKACVQLWLGGFPATPFEWNIPFASRAPYMTPNTVWQNIQFSFPHPQVPVVFLTVPAASVKGLVHTFFSPTLGYMQIRLLPAANGMGWLYLVPNICDVDIYTVDMNIGGQPVSLWTGPSPKAGQVASSALWGGFPDPGVDSLPGFCPAGPLSQDDGFGDGNLDPAGSSVLFMPYQLMAYAWNGTGWALQFGGPFLMPLTTEVAFDVASAPGTWIDGKSIMMTGHPWEPLSTMGGWPWPGVPIENPAKKWVKYAAAWSFIQWTIVPGVTIDLVYGMTEYKVKEEVLVPDINGDQVVSIADVRIAAKSYDAYDEGIPAYPGYKAPWWWRDQSILIDPNTGKFYGPYTQAWVDAFGCPYTVYADPNFDARADMDNNGHINIFDLRHIAKFYEAIIDP